MAPALEARISEVRFMTRLRVSHCAWLVAVAAFGLSSSAAGQTFTEVATLAGSGVSYERVESSIYSIYQAFTEQGVITMDDLPFMPMKYRGAPGVALLDYDNDGDVDIYVTNGPGAANSLFSNQFAQTGAVTFADVAVAAGAALAHQDSTGVCFGDTDNDGDEDLLVLGRQEDNAFLQNNGDGTFTDVAGTSDVAGAGLTGTSCSMGDVDGDGLLDIVVANTFDWSNFFPILFEPFDLNHHNNLYLNTGDNTFADVTGPSGLISGPPNISWATAMVDYDQDGDIDIMFADDQGAITPSIHGGLDRGFLRVHQNDGTGMFSDVTFEVGTAKFGGWMGLTYADINCDSNMDFFATNFGDYLFQIIDVNNVPGENETRWFYQGDGDGTFIDSGPINGYPTLPFGWGCSFFDYDNDGDFDIMWHGGIEMMIWQDNTNPGAIMRNQGACSGTFARDDVALADSTNHSRREVHGSAVGDLNGDGFPDMVSVAARVTPEPLPLILLPPMNAPYDDVAFFTPIFAPIFGDPSEPPSAFAFTGFEFQRGDLSIELNSGVPGANWVVVDTLGTVGITSAGRTNRDGIGAVVTVTPQGGKSSSHPVVGGSSYASQDARAFNFGLGGAQLATVDISWPGGVRNRWYDVRAKSSVRLPEIPCSIDTRDPIGKYARCVQKSLDELKKAGFISGSQKAEYTASALRAYRASR
jgi:hypothetical protein